MSLPKKQTGRSPMNDSDACLLPFQTIAPRTLRFCANALARKECFTLTFSCSSPKAAVAPWQNHRPLATPVTGYLASLRFNSARTGASTRLPTKYNHSTLENFRDSSQFSDSSRPQSLSKESTLALRDLTCASSLALADKAVRRSIFRSSIWASSSLLVSKSIYVKNSGRASSCKCATNEAYHGL